MAHELQQISCATGLDAHGWSTVGEGWQELNPEKVTVSHNQRLQILPEISLAVQRAGRFCVSVTAILTVACMPLDLLGLPHLSTQITAPLGRGPPAARPACGGQDSSVTKWAVCAECDLSSSRLWEGPSKPSPITHTPLLPEPSFEQ